MVNNIIEFSLSRKEVGEWIDVLQTVISYLNKFFPDKYKNTLFSLNSGVGALGEILSGIIFGIIAVKFGLTTTFLVAAIFLLPPIIIYWVVPKINDKTSIVSISSRKMHNS